MNPINGAHAPEHPKVALADQTITALNAGLVEAFTGVVPTLRADGQWEWVFHGDPAQGEAGTQRFVGAPPPWVDQDPRALLAVLDALVGSAGFVYSIFVRGVPTPDGLANMAQVQIGRFDAEAKQLKADIRTEAAPPMLAVGLALAQLQRIDIAAWEQRLFPRLAVANAD